MQLNIDFSPQISAQLTQVALSRGIDPAKLVESLVAEYLPPAVSVTGSAAQPPKYKTPQEHIAAMDAVAEKYANAPILPDSAFDRENIYEDTL
jgi:hypothetical protein